MEATPKLEFEFLTQKPQKLSKTLFLNPFDLFKINKNSDKK